MNMPVEIIKNAIPDNLVRAAIAGLVPAVGFYDIAGSERLLRVSHEPTSEAKYRMIEQNGSSDVWTRTEAAYKSLGGVE